METGSHHHEAVTHHKFPIEVVYNGAAQLQMIEPDETVKQVLDKAILLFHITQQPHLMSLFTLTGHKLDEALTVKAAGVKPEEALLLRQDSVKGG